MGTTPRARSSTTAPVPTSPPRPGGTPAATLQVDGQAVAGDAGAAHVETQGLDAGGKFSNQLWRFPLDGSKPTEGATAPDVDGNALSFYGDPMPIPNGNSVLKIWTTRTGPQRVLMQWTPTQC